MSGFQVDPAALAGPAQGLQQVSVDLSMAASGAATAAGSGGAAAGDPAVTSAAEVFVSGVQAVLTALGEDAGLMAGKVREAAATYGQVDQAAMPAPVPAAPQPAAPMSCGTP